MRSLITSLRQYYDDVSVFCSSMSQWLRSGVANPVGQRDKKVLQDLRFSLLLPDTSFTLRSSSVPSLYRLALRSLPSALVGPTSCSSLCSTVVPAVTASGAVGCGPLVRPCCFRNCVCCVARWWRGTQRESRPRSSTHRLRSLRSLLPAPIRSSLLACSVPLVDRFELRIFRPPRRSRSYRPRRLTAQTDFLTYC